MRNPSPLRSIINTVAIATAILLGGNVNAAIIFSDTYDTSASDTPTNTQDINFEIGTRTSGLATVSGYNSEGTAAPYQTQLWPFNNGPMSGGALLLVASTANASPVWAGPDLDFSPFFGPAKPFYSFSFDLLIGNIDPFEAGFTFGVTAANQGSDLDANHGGLSILLQKDGDWSIFDGSDASTAAVRNGSFPAQPRSILLDVFDSGTDVTLDLSINGFSVSSYTYTGSFAANYVAFSGFTTAGDQAAYFDNFTVTAVPEPSTYALMGLLLSGVIFVRRKSGQVACQ